MLLTRCLSVISSYKQTITKASVGNSQLSDWFSFCREVCMISMENKNTNRRKIGEPGHIVENYECKIGRRKYNRGRLMEGNWILGMIDSIVEKFVWLYARETTGMPQHYSTLFPST